MLTGHDAEGRSTIIADGIAQNVKELPQIPGLALTDLWETAGAPATSWCSAAPTTPGACAGTSPPSWPSCS